MVCYESDVKHVQHAHLHARVLHPHGEIIHCDVFHFDDPYYEYRQNENHDEILPLIKF